MLKQIKNAPAISILMPVKNAGGYLTKCIESIINQTESDWELVAVNDHSADDSRDILESYSNKEERIHFHDNPESGVIHALRYAFRQSKGKFITRMDADDIMLPNKLELLSRRLVQKGRGWLSTGFVDYFSEGTLGDGYRKYANWLNGLLASGNSYSEIYKECVIPSPCWMVHRDDLVKAGGFESQTYPEDYDLCFRFYKASLKVAGVKHVLHKWRDHPNRSSRTQEHYVDNRFLDLKIKYFLELDYTPERPLIIWGAGKKGKYIARKLIANTVPFLWISNNDKKIGHHIYNQRIKTPDSVLRLKTGQIIVSIANPEEQNQLQKELERTSPDLKIHLFC